METRTIETLFDQVMSLPAGQRAVLFEAVWVSTEEHADGIPDEVYGEALRELAAHDADPSSPIPWEVALARVMMSRGPAGEAVDIDSEAFHAELERRYQEHLADPSSSIPWEQVEEELWSRVRGPRPE